MTKQNVTAKLKDSDPITVEYDFGADLKDASALFGVDVVFSNFISSAKIALQDVVRAGIKAKKDAKTIQKDVDAFKLGVKRRSKTKAEKLATEMGKLTPEERKVLLASLTAGKG